MEQLTPCEGNGSAQACFRFVGSPNHFLPPSLRESVIVHRFVGSPSVKDRIETLGAPHTEIGYIRIDGRFSEFSSRLQGNEQVEVLGPEITLSNTSAKPLNPMPDGDPGFVVDVNLGKLSRLLRLLGFDTLYRNDYRDAELADLSFTTNRILLTRDRRLLMRRQVRYGYFVRSDNARAQVVEVMSRFALAGLTRPFHRCSLCNGLVQSVNKADILALLQPLTRRYYDHFWQCGSCQQIYWEGSHMSGLTQLLSQVAVAPS